MTNRDCEREPISKDVEIRVLRGRESLNVK